MSKMVGMVRQYQFAALPLKCIVSDRACLFVLEAFVADDSKCVAGFRPSFNTHCIRTCSLLKDLV